MHINLSQNLLSSFSYILEAVVKCLNACSVSHFFGVFFLCFPFNFLCLSLHNSHIIYRRQRLYTFLIVWMQYPKEAKFLIHVVQRCSQGLTTLTWLILARFQFMGLSSRISLFTFSIKILSSPSWLWAHISG